METAAHVAPTRETATWETMTCPDLLGQYSFKFYKFYRNYRCFCWLCHAHWPSSIM